MRRAAVASVAVAAAWIALHGPLLDLPHFWDEAGYYVPAADDVFRLGALIPVSVPSNAHPPLIPAWVAGAWTIFGQRVPVARLAMLVFSLIGLAGVWRVANVLGGARVAWAAMTLSALHPTVFAQSSLVHIDWPAASLLFHGIADYLLGRRRAALWFAAAAVTKETAILAPAALCAWDVLVRRQWRAHLWWTGVPAAVLAGWYGWHWLATGVLLGNEEFYRYNVAGTLNPVRFVMALGLRAFQTFVHLGMIVVTVALLVRWKWPDAGRTTLWVLIAAHVVAFSVIGGAALGRYLLPVVPLLIVLACDAVRRPWRLAAVAAPVFVMLWFVYLPYNYGVEENLAYRDYVRLHADAAAVLERMPEGTRIATVWPGVDELKRPYLGYVSKPLRVEVLAEMTSSALRGAQYDAAFVFTRDYQADGMRALLEWAGLRKRATAYFGGPHAETPDEIVRAIGRATWRARRGAFEAAILTSARESQPYETRSGGFRPGAQSSRAR